MADTTYFFTNFPNDFLESELWKVFQMWGRVLDIFISRKLNKRNHRFGFVRFKGVVDEVALEKKLDSIWIDTLKLQVNLSRFRRSEVFKKEWLSKKGPVQPRNTWRPKVNHQPHAHLVTGEKSSNSHLDSDVVQLSVKVERISKSVKEIFF